MDYAYLGRTNTKVSRIGLGTTRFGPQTSEKEAFEIMDRALELGINYFDTANIYGGITGRTEGIVGRWMAQGGERRDRVVLGSKVYGDMARTHFVVNEEPGISSYKVRKHLEGSLRRLQTDHIDLYQVHHFDRRVPVDEFFDIFVRAADQGYISYLGTSNFPGWGLAKFQMAAQHRGFLGIVSEQTQYNLMCRIPELEVIPAARDFGIGILAYMPLAGGVLSGAAEAEPGSRTAVASMEYGVELGKSSQLLAFSALCREMGEKEAVVATAWVLHNPAVSSAIFGPRTLEQLEDAVRMVELILDDEVMKRLDSIFGISAGRPLISGSEAPEAYSW
jgi:aryl-alcohol dehydrogenase-like predicted oxidoreductase